MARYARVEKMEIVEGPKELPASWRNISGLHLLSVERLKDHGWLPVTDDPEPVYDPATQKIVTDGYRIEEDAVCRQFAATDLSPEEIQRREDLLQKEADINDLLPSWQQAAAAIDNMTNLDDAKVILRKIAKIIAWQVGVRPVIG